MRVRRHLDYDKPDDFEIETGQSIMELWQNATRGIYVVTIVVTAISLLVGGIVVMNIMLVSVTERIREIGVRKALGARRRDILRQFIVESVILSAVGGALGILGAATFSMGLAAILGGMMSADFSAPVRLWAVLLALFVSTAVGPGRGNLPREPRRRPRPRHRPPERVMAGSAAASWAGASPRAGRSSSRSGRP